MPHFGLMDADELGPEKAALQRARLHIRSGRRRLRQRKISAGIVTLFDALEQALEWYPLAGRGRANVRRAAGERKSSRALYRSLTEAGVLDGSFDFDEFDRLAERALHEEMPDYKYDELLAGFDRVMRSLGVMPFREEDLPTENPSTF